MKFPESPAYHGSKDDCCQHQAEISHNVLFHKGPALLGAIIADLSTLPAMVHRGMFTAFLGACIANIGADIANLFMKLTASGKHFGSNSTYICAFVIQLNATRQYFNVFFLKTGIGTMNTFC
jgi:hypothetical protein